MPIATETKQSHLVHFRSQHEPVRLTRDSNLSEHLTVTNSPVLFGCRTGICGTCLSEVSALGEAALEAPAEDEAELIKVICPNNPKARLACQLKLRCDVRIEPIHQ